MHRQQEMVRKSSLGSALTGCYSTLLESAEGCSLSNALGSSPLGKTYLELLMGMVGAEQDPQHPKVRAVVERVIHAWHAGEKTVIFCFRNNTARRLRDILGERIAELAAHAQRCLGGEKSRRALRGRLTQGWRPDRPGARSHPLVPALGTEQAPGAADGCARASALLHELARLGLMHGIDLTEKDLTRVFFNRATGHVLARRLLNAGSARGRWLLLLQVLVEPSWVEGPYGLSARADTNDTGEDAASFDARGVHFTYRPGAELKLADIHALAAAILARRDRARHSGRFSIFARMSRRRASGWVSTRWR